MRTLLLAAMTAVSALVCSNLVSAEPELSVLFEKSEECYGPSGGDLSFSGEHVLLRRLCDSGEESLLQKFFRDPVTSEPVVDLNGWFTALSGDGEVAVGTVYRLDFAPPEPQSEGQVWRESEGVSSIGQLVDLGGGERSAALGVSPDGATVVGSGSDAAGCSVPAVWTEATGLRALSPAPLLFPTIESECDYEGVAWDASANGDRIVGEIQGAAFVWDESEGMRLLGDLAGQELGQGRALAVTVDGAVVVGEARTSAVSRPFRWSSSAGFESLYDPAHADSLDGTTALAVSAEGDVVVGGLDRSFASDPLDRDRAFLWTRGAGTRSVREVIEGVGLSTSDWVELLSVWAVSGDGQVMAGSGRRWGQFAEESFYVSLSHGESRGARMCSLSNPDCIPVETVARSEEMLSPGFEYNPDLASVYTEFGRPFVNGNGSVAFHSMNESLLARFEGVPTGFSTLRGKVSGAPPRTCKPPPEGFPVLGAEQAGLRVLDWLDHALGTNGDVFAFGELEGGNVPSGVGAGIWRCDAETGEYRGFVLEGAPIVGHPGASFGWGSDRTFQMAEGQKASFFGHAKGLALDPPVTAALFSTTGDGTVVMEVRAGQEIVVAGETRTIRELGRIASNGSGQVAFLTYSTASPDESTFDTEFALWGTRVDGTRQVILHPGTLLPGLESDERVTTMPDSLPLSINANGVILSRGEVRNVVDGEYVGDSVWLWSPVSGHELVAMAGDRFPTTDSGLDVWSVLKPWLNDRGDVLFIGLLDSSSSSADGKPGGFWLRPSDGAAVIPLLRTGQHAPGLPEDVMLGGVTYDENDPNRIDGISALADDGHSTLEFFLEGPGVDATNNRALFYVDRHGGARLIVRKGDLIPGAAGESRTVSDFRVEYGNHGNRLQLPTNNTGQVVAALEFTDGTQAISRFLVPEPGMGSGLLGGVWLISALYRRVKGASVGKPHP